MPDIALAQASHDRGVVYLARIPHGFYEDEMRGYFSQFGQILNLRLSRNRLGASKHYAFIEFESPKVASIVCDTMHNYLLFNRLLQCVVVPNPHDNLFNCAQKFKTLPRNKIQRQRQNKPKTAEQYKLNVASLLEKEDAKRQKLADMGIEYEFGGYRKAAQDAKIDLAVLI